ncbi:MAG TPA: SMP-30/gluconolactonase/LRE family protein [Vicinamibacteria bacterium]|nr:SMP-30/gluconolactonase/LRE family protein [Vicinamibacteria bacterium]
MRAVARTIALGALAGAIWTSTVSDSTGTPPPSPRKTLGSIERLDPRLDSIVAPGAAMEVVAEGYDWLEGPLWVPEEGGYLLFSDIPPNKVMWWTAGEGVRPYLGKSGYPGPIPRPGHIPPDEPGSNGLVLDPQGRLVLCQHGNRQVARMDAPLAKPEPRYVTIASHYQGKRLNSPNDAAYHRDGSLYFTDPPYGLPRKMEDPDKQLDFQGVYRVGGDGKVRLLTKELSRPNGIAFSPDFQTLYVANSDPQRAIWMAYDVAADGSIANGRVFFDATKWVGPGRKGLPDGLKVDTHGHLFATGPGGVLVFDKDARHLGTLATGEATSNCAFGEDGSTLFITADSYVLRLPLRVKGAAVATAPSGR